MRYKQDHQSLKNIHNLQIFNDDEDILKILKCVDEYEGQEIDFCSFVENIDGKDTTFGNEFIQLKKNNIPKGIVALERVFDCQDTNKVKTTATHPDTVMVGGSSKRMI